MQMSLLPCGQMCMVYFGRFMSCISATTASKLGDVSMVEAVLAGFAHAVPAELVEARQARFMDDLSFEACRNLECVADATAGTGLDALPVS